MSRFEVRRRRTWILVWPKIGDDGFSRPALGTVVAIRVRWQDETREGQDASSNLITTTVTIFPAQDIPMGSLIWKGKASELPGTAGVPESDVYVLSAIFHSPSLKYRGVRREYGLSRYADTLPRGG